MNPFVIMEQHKDKFTQNDLLIYQAIQEKPEQVTYMSTSKLAETIGISQPALTRFIKGLGYMRYQDFRSDITKWLARRDSAERSSRMTYFDRLDELLREAEQILTEEYMDDLARFLLNSNHIFASGIMKSMSPAYLLQYLMRKHNRFIYPVPTDSLIDVADHLDSDDLMILFSVSAQPELMDKVTGTNGKVLLITTNPAHNYQDVVTRTVVLPFLPPNPELCSVSPVLFCVFAELLDAAAGRILEREETEYPL